MQPLKQGKDLCYIMILAYPISTTISSLMFWYWYNIDIFDQYQYMRDELIYSSRITCTLSFSPLCQLVLLWCAAGMIDCPGTQDGSSLRSLHDKPPVCGNSFSPLTGALLTGFRLHTGPVLTHTKYLGLPQKAHIFSMLRQILFSKNIFWPVK